MGVGISLQSTPANYAAIPLREPKANYAIFMKKKNVSRANTEPLQDEKDKSLNMPTISSSFQQLNGRCPAEQKQVPVITSTGLKYSLVSSQELSGGV